MENTPDTKTPAAVVRDNEVEDRFELFVDGAPAGVLAYRKLGRDYDLTHTEIDSDFEGRGMGSELIRQVLDQIQANGDGAIPDCPFVLAYLQRHPEYVELVPARFRGQFDLPAR